MSDDIKTIETLLKIYNEEQSKLLQNSPTFFEIIGRSYDEDLISRYIAYVIKNDEKLVYNLFKFYFDEINRTDLCAEKYSDIKVICEKPMRSGRADIFVEAIGDRQKYTLTIENKIWSWEHDEQTVTYYNYVTNNYKNYRNAFLFLKPRGNNSPVACDEFKQITYDELLNRFENNSEKVNDFKKHIRSYLMQNIEFNETDREVTKNINELRKIMDSFENKFGNYKLNLFNSLCTSKALAVKYSPYIFNELNKQGKTNDAKKYWWEVEKSNGIAVEVFDRDSSFRLYRAEKWYKKNEFYFYTELIFKNNDPAQATFQNIIRIDDNKSPLVNFINNNCELGNWQLEGNKWYVFNSSKFECEYDVLSQDWQKKLFIKATEELKTRFKEMEDIFTEFEKFSLMEKQ